MKIYLAGPMTGIVDDNFAEFARFAAKLRSEGHEVFNPAAAGLKGMSRREVLKYDTNWIFDNAEAIALLPGWSYSSGARAEHALALAIGLEVIMFDHKMERIE